MFTSYILMTESLRLHSQAMPKRPESKFPPLCDPDLFNLKRSQISFFSFLFFECDLSLTSVKVEFSVNLKHSGLPFVIIVDRKDVSLNRTWRTALVVLFGWAGAGRDWTSVIFRKKQGFSLNTQLSASNAE